MGGEIKKKLFVSFHDYIQNSIKSLYIDLKQTPLLIIPLFVFILFLIKYLIFNKILWEIPIPIVYCLLLLSEDYLQKYLYNKYSKLSKKIILIIIFSLIIPYVFFWIYNKVFAMVELFTLSTLLYNNFSFCCDLISRQADDDEILSLDGEILAVHEVLEARPSLNENNPSLEEETV